MDVGDRRRRTPDQLRGAREGRAGPRPGGDRRRAHRRALAAAAPRRGLPDVLDLPRGRDLRRHPRDAGPPRARTGHLARAGGDHPPDRPRRARPRAGRRPRPVVEGPRGARVRRPLGRRRARPALLVDERPRGAVRAAPAQRHAPGHRRRRRRPRRRHRVLAAARGVAPPVGGRRRDPHVGRDRTHRRDRGHGPRPVRRPGRLDGRGRGRRVGLALRSAHLSGSTVRLYAGCGIVADSDPEAELAEAQAKFVPVRDALASGDRPLAVFAAGATPRSGTHPAVARPEPVDRTIPAQPSQ